MRWLDWPSDRVEAALRIATGALLVSIAAVALALLLAWWQPFVADEFTPLRLQSTPQTEEMIYAPGDAVRLTIERCNDGATISANITLSLTRVMENGGERVSINSRSYRRNLPVGCSSFAPLMTIPPDTEPGTYRIDGTDTVFSRGAAFQVHAWSSNEIEVR